MNTNVEIDTSEDKSEYQSSNEEEEDPPALSNEEMDEMIGSMCENDCEKIDTLFKASCKTDEDCEDVEDSYCVYSKIYTSSNGNANTTSSYNSCATEMESMCDKDGDDKGHIK